VSQRESELKHLFILNEDGREASSITAAAHCATSRPGATLEKAAASPAADVVPDRIKIVIATRVTCLLMWLRSS